MSHTAASFDHRVPSPVHANGVSLDPNGGGSHSVHDGTGSASAVLSPPVLEDRSNETKENPVRSLAPESTMRSLGELEAAICEKVRLIQLEFMGRGPKDIRAHLIGDLLVIRLKGVLTAAEQQMTKSTPMEIGRNLIKQFRTQLIALARPRLEILIEDVVGAKVISQHHDISTRTGEEILVFSLSEAPIHRASRKR